MDLFDGSHLRLLVSTPPPARAWERWERAFVPTDFREGRLAGGRERASFLRRLHPKVEGSRRAPRRG